MKALFAMLACAGPVAAATAAETYTIDPNHSAATFSFEHLGFSRFYGKFPSASGTITLDRANRRGSADVTFDAAGVVTGVPKFNEHLRSEDFFDVAKYPRITFKSDDFRFEGDTLKEVAGELTVHGVTKPVTLKVTSFTCKTHPMHKVPACGANAQTTVKRSEFGMDAYVPAVSDEIPLEINVEAVNKQAQKGSE